MYGYRARWIVAGLLAPAAFYGVIRGGLPSLGIVTGAAIASVALFAGNALFTLASHRTNRPAINSISYADPVIALAALWAFTEVDIAHPEYFIVGSSLIIVLNVLLHLNPEGAN